MTTDDTTTLAAYPRLTGRAGLRSALAVGTVAALVLAPSAVAADGGTVSMSNTETVQAYLDATGKLDVARVYEQLAFQGSGTVEVVNPVSTDGLRNLDGFGIILVRRLQARAHHRRTEGAAAPVNLNMQTARKPIA